MIGGEVVAACLLGLALLATDPLHFIGLRQVMERDFPYGLVTDGFIDGCAIRFTFSGW